jgi:predicted exporter
LLQPLVDDGTLAGFESPSRLLPDRKTQLQRRDRLPPPQALRQLVGEATAGTPLRAQRLGPFIDDVERSRQLEPLGVADVAGTAIGLAIESMMVTSAAGTTAILPLRAPDTGPNPMTIEAQAVRRALAGHGADGSIHLIDIKEESESLYTQYLAEARLLAGVGVALIVLLIACAQFRRSASPMRGLARVVLPIGAALICVVAGLAVAGIGLTILHLVGLLLTVAVGSNYTLFFIDDSDDNPRLLASLALANATTIIGFGILGFASVPVLNAIGMTVGPGALLCLLFAAMLSTRQGTARPRYEPA